MKKLATAFLIIIFLLSACGQSAPVPVIENATATPSPFPSNTSSPTHTPTASITPLPTIPTFTPTFDVSTIVTVTPVLPRTCPQINSETKLDTTIFYEHLEKYFDDQIFKGILEYLNAGGSWNTIDLELSNSEKYGRSLGSINELDLTNDNTNEIVLEMWAGFGIYSCQHGLYELLLNLNGVMDGVASIIEIKDMNLNGMPEVVVGIAGCSGHCLDLSIFEWDGQEFQNLLGEWQIITSLEEEVIDVNNDGVFELVIEGPFPSMGSYIDYLPLRGQEDTYFWNGNNYDMSRSKFSPPTYRFQAIQDGDAESLDGNFDKALIFYKEVILSEKLQWWSMDRREHEIKLYLDIWDPAKPTPLPEPPEDKTEYPRLAAYAYYRIMLLHFVQGQESEAATTYQTLQETFGNDPYARPYAEMASAFWEAYQPAHSVYDGCAAAIQYAVEHPEILIPLGSDYHGAQSHTYVPADVCPFR